MPASKRVVRGLWLAVSAAGAVIASLAVTASAFAGAASELVEFDNSIQGTFQPGTGFSAQHESGVHGSGGSNAFASFGAIGGAWVDGDGASLFSTVYYRVQVSAYIQQLVFVGAAPVTGRRI